MSLVGVGVGGLDDESARAAPKCDALAKWVTRKLSDAPLLYCEIVFAVL